MIVKATEIKNSFGKYLKQLESEDIVVTKNGSPVAKISKCDNWGGESAADNAGKVCEAAIAYNYNSRKMTFEEFLKMRETTEDRYEYIDGEAYFVASPSITHQRIVGNLHVSFRLWFKGKKCMPYFSPFDVVLVKGENNMNLVQPDLLIVCDPENRNEKDRYTGTPSLVVEVLSDSTTRMDLIRKLNLYMDTGVLEYWIVNPIRKEVIVYSFKDKEAAKMLPYVRDDIVGSVLFEGLDVPLAEVFE